MAEKLIRLLKLNRQDAQQNFYKKYSEQMFIICHRYINSELDAGTVVNGAFFKILKSINKFNYINEQALVGWMKKIVINEALIFLRSQLSHNNIDDDHHNIWLATDITDSNLLLEDYYNLIKELPADLRTVFNLYAIDGYSHKEIANKTGLTESSSRVYLSRARKLLQQKLTKNL